MSNNSPLVSIGLMTFNRCESFELMLISLLSQTYLNIEIIVGDNSTNNETKTLYEEKYSIDKRIKYFKHEGNLGALSNALFLIKNATGKYFMFSADDDLWDSTFIEKAVAKLENDEGAVACWCKVQCFDENGIYNIHHKYDNLDISGDDVVANLVKFNTQYAWYGFYCLIRSDILDKIDFKSFNAPGNDVIILNQIILLGRIIFLDERLFYYRTYSKSTNDRHNHKNANWNEYCNINPYLDLLLNIFKTVLKSNNINIIQKNSFFIRFWINILSDTVWIENRCNLFPKFKFFMLLVKRCDFSSIFILLPYILGRLNIFRVIRNENSVIFFLFGIKITLKKVKTNNINLKNVKKNSVLIVEPNPCHNEVLPGYAKYFIDLGYNVDVVILYDIKNELPFSRFNNEKIKLYYMNLSEIGKLLASKYINKYDQLFISSFNLYYNDNMPNIFEYFNITQYKKNKTTAVAHDLGYISESILSKYNLITLFKYDRRVPFVNPHYFGDVKVTPKNNDIVRFLIPHNIDGRYNYDIVIDAVKKLKESGINNFKIVIVGNLFHREYLSKIFSDNLITFFEILGRLNFYDLFNEIEKSDFIITLFDNGIMSCRDYLTKKISGSFQLSYGFLKPLIIQKTFSKKYSITTGDCVIYDSNDDLYIAMKNSIEMNNNDYQTMQKNIKTTANIIYSNSLQNLKEMIE